MRIAIRSFGSELNHLNGFGGLEQRFAVNWAEFLRFEGHDVVFFDEPRGCDSSFDLALDVPIANCANVNARRHVHCTFKSISLNSRDIQENPCYKAGDFFYANPYRIDYRESIGMRNTGYNHNPVFLPIPYPDHLLPSGLTLNGFDRTEIMWANKGNFDPVFDENHHNHYFVTHGLLFLDCLVKLNQKVDFKVTFALDSIIRRAKPEWEVEERIASLRNVERVDRLVWTDMVARMSRCKLNMHPGGLTGGINEAIFVGTLPVNPKKTPHLNVLEMVPAPQTATFEETYDLIDRLWFDKNYYRICLEEFMDVFKDHRTDGVRRHWKNFLELMELDNVS